jgi:hypothetical protein
METHPALVAAAQTDSAGPLRQLRQETLAAQAATVGCIH